MTPDDKWLPLVFVALVAFERLAELIISRSNQQRLLARGGFEVGASHYPFMVALHVAWLASVAAWAAFTPPHLNMNFLAAYVLVQPLRFWVMSTLGEYWTTRIIMVPDAPLIAHGPYRFVKHPNYIIVIAEIALLPLALGATMIALVFSLLNAAMLWVRIRAENAALAQRPR